MSNFSYQNSYNDATGLFQSGGTSGGGSGVPVGTIVMYPKISPPTGWTECNGDEFSKGGVYAALYAVISTQFNNPSTPTNKFAVPDMRGRFPIGYDTGGYSGGLAHSQPPRAAAAQSKKIEANQLPTHTHAKGTLAVSEETATNQTTTAVNQDTTAVNQDTTAVNQDTTAVNNDATLSTTGLDHTHWYGHLHFNPHTHDLAVGSAVVTGGSHDHAAGTIAYTQNPHDHAMPHQHTYPHTHGLSSHTHNDIHSHTMGDHTHDLGDHVHDLDAPGYTGNWAFPFGYNRIGTGNYGYWYGTGTDAAANGASACYYPRSIAEQNNTTNPAGSGPSTNTTDTQSSTTTTGPNLNITDNLLPSTYTAGTTVADTTEETATGTISGSVAAGGVVSGTISGDTGNQKGTEYADPLVTGNSRSTVAPHNSDVYTNQNPALTIPDHTHTQIGHNHVQIAHNHTQIGHNHLQIAHGHAQDPHDHTITGDTGNNTTTHLDFQPPLLCLSFIIKFSAS